MAAWTRCDRCRKVKPSEDFDAASPTCRACLAAPARKRSGTSRTSGVTTRRTKPATAPDVAQSGPRPALLGVAGSGDLEVRERRARRLALDQLAETHAEDFAHLLQQARESEGLRR